MNEPELKKKSILNRIINNQLTVTIFTTILMIFVVVGSSYAIFSKNDETGNNDVVVVSGEMEAVVSSEDDTITDEYTDLGVTDEVGLAGESYDFTVTNTGENKIVYYEVRIIDKEYAISTMPHKALKFSISYNSGEYTTPSNLGDNGSYIYVGGPLEVGETDTFSLKLWVTQEFGELARDKELIASLELTLYNELPTRNYIIYDLNGGVGIIPKTSVSTGRITTIIPHKDGKMFSGWSEDKDATEPEYLSGGAYTKDTGTILYAIWKDVTLYEVAEINLEKNLLPSDGEVRFVAGGKDDIVNNYVNYNEIIFRIVSLNNDGSIKLVENDEHLYCYTATSCQDFIWNAYESFEDTDIYQYLNNNYLSKLQKYNDVLVTNYMWNGTEDNSATFEEVVKPEKTTMIEGAVGLLNLYELVSTDARNLNDIHPVNNLVSNNKKHRVVKLAPPDGGIIGNIFEINSWLNKKIDFRGNFLITTHHSGVYGWDFSSPGTSEQYYADSNGEFSNSASHPVKPSIVLKAGLLYASGDGSEDNPFVFEY